MSRKSILWFILLGGYLIIISSLSWLWYLPQAAGGFKFFNDLEEWRYMDKLGHVFCSFHIARFVHALLIWGRVENKAILIASIVSFGMISSIEILDAFSVAYGFSVFDLIANLLGVALFYFQMNRWHGLKILPKFSFWPSGMAALRPEMLGKGIGEQVVKDYNGQIYWLSLPIFHWIKPSIFPKWLCVSLGYGAGGMLFAREAANLAGGFNPFSCLYISLDISFSALPVKHPILKVLLSILDLLKFPFWVWIWARY